MIIDQEQAWAAFDARDRAADGRFVVAVTTTGIYCKPSCPPDTPAARTFPFTRPLKRHGRPGYRACLRCRPDELGRDRTAVAEAVRLLDAGQAPALDALAARVGYAPHHFHRLFKRATGVTPAAYARARRADRAATALNEEKSVTDAVYAAGYSGPSRFYDDARRLGMTPTAWARGGAGETIRWTVAATSLGPLLVAATAKGLCRVAFDEDEAALRRRFPHAAIEPGDPALAELAERVVAQVESPERDLALPRDVRGTAFQEAIWRELARIPLGETRTYAELAALAGRPRATRAAGSACGANPLVVLTPCHRAKRGDGSLGGFAYGLERKRELLARETDRTVP